MKTTRYDSKWPYRQDDPRWAEEPMWDRNKVIEVHTKYNGQSLKDAQKLLRFFDRSGGNTIENEGCLLTCLAMVLHLLHLNPIEPGCWNPSTLNQKAQERLYYSLSGLSMATLYADIVTEVTEGEVQLCAKEEYLSGENGWKPVFAPDSFLLRAYRYLNAPERAHMVAMIKTGTYNDTIASHYVLVDPNSSGNPDDRDFPVLDPAMPIDTDYETWMLSDSSGQITKDRKIQNEWKSLNIDPLQIGGVLIFARWHRGNARLLMSPPLVRALAKL
jgi:hypothetical protein